MLTRDQLHRLIDALPEDQLGRLGEAADKIADPFLRAFVLAEDDDEPLTAEDRAAIEEAEAAPDLVPWEEYRAARRGT